MKDLVKQLSEILRVLNPSVINTIVKSSDVHFEGHPWSFLKLAVLAYWVDLYLKIIPRYFDHIAYLDLFSGSGTTRVQETGDIILGSALLVPYMSAQYPKSFSEYLFFEKDDSRRKALGDRLSILRNIKNISVRSCKILPDCNLISNPSFNLNYDHFLAFIDCPAPRYLRWTTLRTLLEARKGDIMFIWLRINFARALGKGEHALTNFFGDDSWRSCQNVRQLRDLFLTKLSEYRSFADVLSIEGKFPIDIVIATKRGPYISAWEYLKLSFSELKPKDVEALLNVFKGKSSYKGYTSLHHFH